MLTGIYISVISLYNIINNLQEYLFIIHNQGQWGMSQASIFNEN